MREHVAHLVVIGAGVRLAIEIAALPAPIGPGAGEAIEDLAGARFAAVPLLLGQVRQRRFVGRAARQPLRYIRPPDLAQPRRPAGLAEVLLRQDVAGYLAPAARHLDTVQLEDQRNIGRP